MWRVEKLLSRQMRMPIVRALVFASVVILGLNCVIIIVRGVISHRQALEDGKAESERLVRILSNQAELTFLAADLTLRRVVDKQYFNALFGNKLQQDVQNNLTLWVNENPQLSALMMTDEKGQIKVIARRKGYETWMDGKDNIEREDYFRFQRESPDGDVLFAQPQPNWIEGGKFIIMSRRINKIDGSFGGIVVAAISNNYLTDFYDSLHVASHTKMLLMVEDQKLLIGKLDDPREEEMLRSRLAVKNVNEMQPGIHTAIEDRGWDQELRIISYSYLPDLHVAIALVMQGDDIFAEWWRERRQDVLLFSVFTLFVALLSSFTMMLVRQIRRGERSEKTAIVASQAKSDFLANMSHELRTPLNAIIGFSEMLDSGYFGTLNSKQKERVHDIHMCGTHLLELINDILDFSKGEAGKLELKEEKFNVNTLVQECIRFLAERARTKKVELIDIVPKEFPRVQADLRKIKQTLINLISNAVKFSYENSKVEVSARLTEDGRMVIMVSDRGIGMAPEDIPKALSVFGQVHKVEGYEGTGLGLPLCKVFVELHGGKLRIESLKGVGTRVSIILPATRVLKED